MTTDYWPKTGSSTEQIVLWFRKNRHAVLTAQQIQEKFDVYPSQVSALGGAPLYTGLIKRVRVPHSNGVKYAYMAGDAR